jgi:excisionase family DNA binding protein
MEKITMNVQEMAVQMGISLPKAYELTRSFGFPVVRVGTRVLIPIVDFQKWLSAQAVSGANSEGGGKA